MAVPLPPLILHPPPLLKMRTLTHTSSSPSLRPTSFLLPQLRPTSFLFPFKPKRFHLFKPCSSSLKESKKESLQKSSINKFPLSLTRLVSSKDSNGDNDEKKLSDDGFGGENAFKGTILAGILLVGVVGGFGTVGYAYRDQINSFLTQFTGFIEGYGPAGYALFVVVYAGLEKTTERTELAEKITPTGILLSMRNVRVYPSMMAPFGCLQVLKLPYWAFHQSLISTKMRLFLISTKIRFGKIL